MKQIDKTQKRRIIYIFLVVMFAFLAVYFYVRPTGSINTTTGSYFVFNATGAGNWWAGQNNFPVDSPPPEYQGDVEDLKYTDFVVFQGTRSLPGRCFVAFLYNNKGQKDESLVLDNAKRRVTSEHDDLSLKEISNRPESIRAFGKDINYVLYSYELIGSPGQDIARGMQVGYVQLEEGYIEVRTVCRLPSELDDAKPVLDTIELRAA